MRCHFVRYVGRMSNDGIDNTICNICCRFMLNYYIITRTLGFDYLSCLSLIRVIMPVRSLYHIISCIEYQRTASAIQFNPVFNCSRINISCRITRKVRSNIAGTPFIGVNSKVGLEMVVLYQFVCGNTIINTRAQNRPEAIIIGQIHFCKVNMICKFRNMICFINFFCFCCSIRNNIALNSTASVYFLAIIPVIINSKSFIIFLFLENNPCLCCFIPREFSSRIFSPVARSV